MESNQKYGGMDIIDDFNPEALLNEAYYSFPATRLVQKIKEVLLHRAKPKRIRTDNGPEFISKAFKDFCEKQEIEIQYVQLGKPAQYGGPQSSYRNLRFLR